MSDLYRFQQKFQEFLYVAAFMKENILNLILKSLY